LTSPDSERYRKMTTVDEILLMLVPSISEKIGEKISEWVGNVRRWIKSNWIRVFAPELIGRNLYQVSPEIWVPKGGLGRVMQYHGVGMPRAYRERGRKIETDRPHYQYTSDGKALDYTKDIPHPMKSLEEIKDADGQARVFKVTVGEGEYKKEVEFVISKVSVSLE